MKLLSLFLTISLGKEDRAYSNYPPFLTDGSEKQTWKKNNGNIQKYNRLEPAVDSFYDTFFMGNAKAARFAGHMRRLLSDVRLDLKKQVQRCDKRSKRGESVLPTDPTITDNYKLPVGNGIKKGYEALFFQHARWAREEIYWDCPLLGMRVFKRLDRLRWLTVYFYCDRVDNTAGFCTDTYYLNGVPKPKPRKHTWFNDYYGRYSLVAYDGVACEHDANGPTTLGMTCPLNHEIKVVSAQYGRWNPNTCTVGVDKSSLVMCDQYVNVQATVADKCDGQQDCDIRVNSTTAGDLKDRNDPCPETPKYTRIRWLCDPSKEFLTYGN